jgi:hypothetical protein
MNLFNWTLAVINIVTLWIVYTKAGQPGWAVIIPFYNVWVLARVADMSGWAGIGLITAWIVPYIGPIIFLILYIAIMIGIARSFNRSVLFGVGLIFFPPVFFAILAYMD